MSEEKVKEEGKQSSKSRGVGQVIERGPDKFLIRVYIGRDSTGKRHYHNESFHGKKKAAKAHLRRILTKLSNNEPLSFTKDTLSTFIDEWLTAHPDLKESSLSHYGLTMARYVRPTLGKRMLNKIEADDVQALYATLSEKGLAPSSIAYVHTLLRSLFKLAIIRRKVLFNPMEGVKSPAGKKLEQAKRQGRELRTMSPDQVEKFLAEAAETRFSAIFNLAFYTGCRPGELLGLRWDDLDGPGQVLHIRQTINWRKGGEWYLDTPKTATGRRNLRLTAGLVDLLDRHRKRQLEERMKAGKAWNDHGFIFCDEIGEPYSQNRLRYFYKQILRAAELPEHFNPYSARHTSATLLIAQGVNAKTVSERLGHSDVLITLRTYTHPTGEMHDAASEQAEALIRGKK